MTREVRRWLEGDVPAELRDVLASAAEDRVETRSLTRLRARVEGTLGAAAWNARAPGGGPLAAQAGQQTVASAALATKFFSLPGTALALSALLGIGVATYALRQPKPRVEPPPVAAPMQAQTPSAPVLPKPHTSPPSAAATEPRAPVVTSRTGVVAQAGENSLAAELKGLERVRASMDDPDRALAVVQRHARRFPHGALIPERELLQLETLYETGQLEKARRLAERITDESVRHPYRAQALQLQRRYDTSRAP